MMPPGEHEGAEHNRRISPDRYPHAHISDNQRARYSILVDMLNEGNVSAELLVELGDVCLVCNAKEAAIQWFELAAEIAGEDPLMARIVSSRIALAKDPEHVLIITEKAKPEAVKPSKDPQIALRNKFLEGGFSQPPDEESQNEPSFADFIRDAEKKAELAREKELSLSPTEQPSEPDEQPDEPEKDDREAESLSESLDFASLQLQDNVLSEPLDLAPLQLQDEGLSASLDFAPLQSQDENLQEPALTEEPKEERSALELLLFRVEAGEMNSDLCMDLGDAYLAASELQLARKWFDKSLELSGNNRIIEDIIEHKLPRAKTDPERSIAYYEPSKVFTYPFREGGWISHLILAIIWFLLAEFLGSKSFLFYLSLAFTIPVSFLTISYFVKILEFTLSRGDNPPLLFEGISNLWTTTFQPALLVVAITLIYISPIGISVILLPENTNIMLSTFLIMLTIVWGCLTVPVALVVWSCGSFWAALNLVQLARLVIKIGRIYYTVALVSALAVFLFYLITGFTDGSLFTSGSSLKRLAVCFCMSYLLIILFHIYGLLFRDIMARRR